MVHQVFYNTKHKALLYSIVGVFCFFCSLAQPVNIDFNSGNIGGWSAQQGNNLNSVTVNVSTYFPSTQYSVVAASSPEINNVPVSMTSPLGGNFVRLGKTTLGGITCKLSQTFSVTAASSALVIAYLPVWQNVVHSCTEQPFFNFVIKDSGGNSIPSSNLHLGDPTICNNGVTGVLYHGSYAYTNWNTLSIDLTNYIGTSVTIEFAAGGCISSQGAHSGYAYVDAMVCTNSTANYLDVNGTAYSLLSSQNNLTICGTNSMNITAPAGASSYLWSGSGISGMTSQNIIVTQPGTYSLTYTSALACSNITQVSFTVEATPTVSVAGPSAAICPGVSTTLTVTGAGSYTWKPVPTSIAGGGADAMYSPGASLTYTVIGASTNGCKDTALYTIQVLQGPNLSISGNTVICAGSAATFTASGADVFHWSTGSTANSIIDFPFSGTSYVLTGTIASSGCTQTKSVTLTVNPIPSLTTNSGSVCVGQTFTITPAGATTYTYSNGSNTVSPLSNSTYTITGTGSNGCVNSMGAISNVTVITLPVVMATTSSSLICMGSQVTLTGSGATTYTWTNGVQDNVPHTPSATAVYTVTGTSNGCSNRAVAQVVVNACTRISEVSINGNSIGIFPNPASTSVTIHSGTTLQKIELISIAGQIILAENVSGNQHQLNLTDIANGVYFVVVQDANQKVTRKKLVVQH